MTNLNRNSIEQLIGFLSSKELKFLAPCRDGVHNHMLYLRTIESGRGKGKHKFWLPELESYYLQSHWDGESPEFQVLGHPVFIGRILARLPQVAVKLGKRTQDLEDDLITTWRKCDETLELSLQDLFFGEGVEWQEVEVHVAHPHIKPEWKMQLFPKDKNLLALGEFLLSLNLVK